MIRSTQLAIVVALAACAAPTGGPAGGPPDGPPYIEGTASAVTPADGGGTVLVEEEGEGNKAVLTVTADTTVVQEVGGGYEPITFDQLAEGQRVAVWVSGPVRESFPVQATADAVVIRE